MANRDREFPVAVNVVTEAWQRSRGGRSPGQDVAAVLLARQEQAEVGNRTVLAFGFDHDVDLGSAACVQQLLPIGLIDSFPR